MKFLVPLEDNKGLDSPLCVHFGRAPYYAIVTITVDGYVDYRVKNLSLEHGGRCGAYSLIDDLDIDAVIVRSIGPRAASAFQSKGIPIFVTNSTTLRGVIEEAKQQKLIPYSPQIASCDQIMQGRGLGRRRRYPPPYPPYPPYMPFPYPPSMMPPSSPLMTRRTTQRAGVKPGVLRVAVACVGRGGLDDYVSMQFGRAPAFTIVDLEGGQVKNVVVEPNQYMYQPHGVGIAVAQHMANRGVQVIIAGRFGPNATSVLQSVGIKMVTVPPNTRVKDALRFIS